MKVELTYTEKNEIYYVNSQLPERTRANARKIELMCVLRAAGTVSLTVLRTPYRILILCLWT